MNSVADHYLQKYFNVDFFINVKMFTKTKVTHLKTRNHCVRNFRIWSFFWFLFSHIWFEYGDLWSKFSAPSPNTGKYGPEKTLYLDTFHTLNVQEAWTFPAGIYLHKVSNRNTEARREICSELTIKTPERR